MVLTNREKYIDSASDEKLAKWLAYRYIYNPLTDSIVCYDAIKENSLEVNNMKYWLSQEAKESWGIDENHTQVVNLPTETKKVELTEQAYKDILSRLDKLEEEGKTKDPKDFAEAYIQPNDYNYGTAETKSADEMFEELGYKKDTFDEFGVDEIIYINNNKDHIIVRKNGHYIKYNYYNFHPDFDYNDIKFITEAEDKAIHKKIEELKNVE